MLAKRLESITNLLQQSGSVEVSDLSKRFGVTEKTIRQDLVKLEELHIATRVHGGAMLYKGENEIFPVNERKGRRIKNKQAIARAALDRLVENDVVFLDSGTTTLELAKMIDKRVIVITPDPFIQTELMRNEAVTLYSTGGRLKRDGGSYTFVGPDAVHMIRSYRARKCFVGASALDCEQGLMIFSTEEMDAKRAMIKSSQEVIALVDSSKLEQIAFVSFAALDEINVLITDSGISEALLSRLTRAGLSVQIADDSD